MVRHTTFSYMNDFYSFEADQPTHDRIAQMVETVQRMGHNSKEHVFAVTDGDIVVIYSKGKDPLLDDVRIAKILSIANKFDKPDVVNQNHKQIHEHTLKETLECPECRPSKRKIKADMKKIIEQ